MNLFFFDMENDSYQTIVNPSTGIYKEKGSKFLSFAYPVLSEEEAKSIIIKIKKEYHDARHHCFAYQIGVKNIIQRANDDGEPSNSAGKPILNQIQAQKLNNILIVVVRYFGGTLLGVSGLINAYKIASIDALQNSKIIVKNIIKQYEIEFDYPEMNTIMKILKEENIKQISHNFDAKCFIKIEVKKSNDEKLISKLSQYKSIHYQCLSDN